MPPSPTPGSLIALLALAALAACGSSGSSAGTARAPAKSGDVWVVANPDDRAAAPGAILAYIHGLHTFVLDGNDAYLGMTHVQARKGENGARVFALPGAGEVQVIATGDSLEIRFPGGETVPLTRRRSQAK